MDLDAMGYMFMIQNAFVQVSRRIEKRVQTTRCDHANR